MASSRSDPLETYQGPWDEKAAAHLLNRTGFSATIKEIEAALKGSLSGAVRRCVHYDQLAAAWPKPEWAHPESAPENLKTMGMAEREAMKRDHRKQEREWAGELQYGWLRRMAQTPRPLEEKLTLFWHGHFATSFQKVKRAYLMWLQNETLRRNASGNFKTMVIEVSRDPAMVIWLDNLSNRKRKPNENYARELMELFTLGEGNGYTEEDIKEAARAFTGWGLANEKQDFYFNPNQHDLKEKLFMGKRGNWDGVDIIEIIFKKPECARFIAEKLWAYFAYEQPEPEIVQGLAMLLRQSDYELKPLLTRIFSCNAFYSDRAVHTQIKSPVQLVVGAYQLLQKELPANDSLSLVLRNGLRLMGQELLLPPDVDGWDGGMAWVNTSSLFLRYNFASYLVHGVPPSNTTGKVGGKATQKAGHKKQPRGLGSEVVAVEKLVDPAQVTSSENLVRQLARILWNSPPDEESLGEFTRFLDTDESGAASPFKATDPGAAGKIRSLIHLMMSTPQFQLC